MGTLGFCIFGASLIFGTKGQDISASAAWNVQDLAVSYLQNAKYGTFISWSKHFALFSKTISQAVIICLSYVISGDQTGGCSSHNPQGLFVLNTIVEAAG